RSARGRGPDAAGSQGARLRGRRRGKKENLPLSGAGAGTGGNVANRIRLIGMQIDLGAGRRGVDMGPSALRVAGLEARLEALGLSVEDSGDIKAEIPEASPEGSEKLKYAEVIAGACGELAGSVKRALDEGALPVTLGGDHSLAIGTLAGSSAYYRDRPERIGVIWL